MRNKEKYCWLQGNVNSKEKTQFKGGKSLMMEEEILYRKAYDLAERRHRGQTRIGGEPYITHPEGVAQIVREHGYGIQYQVTALFHDLLEDTDAQEQEILEIGGQEVLDAVKLLTKEKGYVMQDYIGKIRKNKLAFAVKGADRLHNLRSAMCTDEKFKRKYIKESVEWYLDFMPEIPFAVKELAESLEEPLTEFPFLYTPVSQWERLSE